MWGEWFVRLKNDLIETILTMKRIMLNPVMMTLHSLWIVMSFQEENWIKNARRLADEDQKHQIPNESLQGAALTAETCPPSLIVRSALRLQFWIFYWKLERERMHLSRTLPSAITEPGQPIPYTAKLIPVLTENISLFDNNDQTNIPTISLRSLMKEGRYLVNLNSPIDFIIIYIKEAHASDGWKFDGEGYSFIANHRDVQDRIEAVKTMIELAKINKEDQISVYCDTMNDHTNHLFRGWPERIYVLYNQKILYQGPSGPFGYSIPSLDGFLKQNVLNQE